MDQNSLQFAELPNLEVVPELLNHDTSIVVNSNGSSAPSKQKLDPATSMKKRGQAPIWGWFEKVQLETGEKPTHAGCTICSSKVSIMNSATTPMINHMKRHHGEIFENEVSKKLRGKKYLVSNETPQLGQTLEIKSNEFSNVGEVVSNEKKEQGSNEQERIPINVSSHSSILETIKSKINEKFSSLSIHQALSPDGVPFIHIWKPISKLAGFQGMPFLPCFHIIGTVVSESSKESISSASEEYHKTVLFQLHSLHGKVLADESITIQNLGTMNSELVTKMAEDQLQMCRGIEEMNREKFVQFIRSCKLPSIISKVRSVCLIEQLMGSVVIRSRLCKFVLFEGQNKDSSNLSPRCEECDAFENHSTDTWMEDITMQGHNRLGMLDSTSKYSSNPFERVYCQTSAADMEEMAVFQKVQQMYEESCVRTISKKTQAGLKEDTLNELQIANIKSEPRDLATDVCPQDAAAKIGNGINPSLKVLITIYTFTQCSFWGSVFR